MCTPLLSQYTCPVCGKQFYFYPQWVYKEVDSHSHVKKFCSYRCLLEFRRKKRINKKFKETKRN
nr:MAG TPA: NosL protein beta topology, Metal transport [Caudoviricetes sp.]